MITGKDFRPMLELMLISEKWEMDFDETGKMHLKLNGTPESVEAGLDKVSDKSELEELADRVEARIRKRQIEALRKKLSYGGGKG